MTDLGPPPKKRTRLCFIGTELPEPEGEDVNMRDTPSYVKEGSVQSDAYVMYENPQTGESFRLRETSDSVAPEQAPRTKQPRKVIPKRLLPDFEADDEVIIQLKELSRSDEKVVEALAKKGSTKYTAHRVATRWLRIRRALEMCDDENMDDELYDWQLGEDAKLHESVQFALAKHQEELQKLEEKKWKNVESHLADLLGTKKYTARACRERHEAILTGDALLPLKLDPDQDGRALARQQRISSAKSARAKLNADAEREINEQKRAEIEEKRAKIAAQEREKADKEAETARQKHKAQADRQRAQMMYDAQKSREKAVLKWETAVWEAENLVFIQLANRPIDQKRGTLNHFRKVMKSKMPKMIVSDDEEQSGDEDSDDDDAVEAKRKAKEAKKAAQLKEPIPPGRANVTAETIASPRSIMTMNELDYLLVKRKLQRHTADETHPQVVARLHWTEHYMMMSEDLSMHLLRYGDKGKGSKIAKSDRLAVYDAKASKAGLRGITSTDPDFVRHYATKYPGALSKSGTEKARLGADDDNTIDQLFQEYGDTVMDEED